MSVYSDAPTEDDELGRERYVEALADIAERGDTPLVVALYGAWGSGKTSLMRQLRRRLERDPDGSEPIRTVWFDPWMHQFDDSPAIGLLHATTEQLGLAGDQTVKDALVKISIALAEDIRVPYLGLRVGRILKVREELANDEFRRRELQARLRQEFHRVLQAAGAPSTRLIFFIDDLDRCQPKRTLDVLEALKLYLDFEGCVYILGVDRAPLEAAIRTEYKELGLAASSYLDKIVQLPFSLPAIGDVEMRDFVAKRVPPHLDSCLEVLVTAGADDPRQVKRIINSLRLNDTLVPPTLRPSYQPPILAALVLIQTFVPDLYRELRREPARTHELFQEGADTGELWTDHVAALPQLAAALRLVTMSAGTDLRPYFTLTAAVATPPIAEPPPPAPLGAQTIDLGAGPAVVSLPEDQVGSLALSAIGALRRCVASLKAAPSKQAPSERARAVLPPLALVGRRVYVTVLGLLDDAARKALEEATSGVPQIVSIVAQEGAAPLPAAVMYDQPLDSSKAADSIALCSSFHAALVEGLKLEDTQCWQERCPSFDDPATICPSGFWGFRHAIAASHPVRSPLAPRAPADSDQILIGVAKRFLAAEAHAKRLRDRAGDRGVWVSSTEELLASLQTSRARFVYLYPETGIRDGHVWLSLGDSDRVPLSSLSGSFNWREARPLVVLNIGVEGEGQSDLGRLFMRSGASGVISPEVPMLAGSATHFAEELIARLLDGQQAAWAVRDARLGLLSTGDPLGLAYRSDLDPEPPPAEQRAAA